jgi:hypothetical protein
MFKLSLDSSSNEDLEEFLGHAKTFLDSFIRRDKKTFVKYLNPKLEHFAVLPMGEFVGVQAYVDSQEHWFNGTTGAFSYQFEHAYTSSDLAMFSIRAIYENLDEKNIPFRKEIIITNLYRKVEGSWFQIFSQNTVVNLN